MISNRVIGPVYHTTVASTAGAVTTLVPFGNDQINWAEFLNCGQFPVLVVVGPNSTGLPTPSIPASGTATPNTGANKQFVLPAGMTQARTIAVPQGGGGVTGFSYNAVALLSPANEFSDLFVTPVEAQP